MLTIAGGIILALIILIAIAWLAEWVTE